MIYVISIILEHMLFKRGVGCRNAFMLVFFGENKFKSGTVCSVCVSTHLGASKNYVLKK